MSLEDETITVAITGMTCAACAARVERVLQRAPGVRSATVNLVMEAAHITFDPRSAGPDDLAEAIRRAGYDVASAPTGSSPPAEPPPTDRRLVAALALATPGVLLGMAHTHAIPAPVSAAVQLALALPVVLWAGLPIHLAAARAARAGHASMDTLVSVGTLSALFASLLGLAADGPHAAVYFEAASATTALVLLGRHLEARARRDAADALRSLDRLLPATAWADTAEGPLERPVDTLRVGDRVIVRPGARVPADGLVRHGRSVVDEGMLTGEADPRPVDAGDRVHAGTINLHEPLHVAVTSVGADTTARRIARLVTDAQARRPELARLADRLSSVFVPAVLALATLTVAAWWSTGPLDAVRTGAAVLVVACPCALGLATPTALVAATARAARAGLLLADASALERAANLDVALLDKTGTLTAGRPTVQAIQTLGDLTEDRCLQLAAAAERHGAHPLAAALVREAGARGIAPLDPTNLTTTVGAGVSATVDGHTVRVGRPEWAGVPPDPTASTTTVGLSVDGRPAARFAVADRLRPEAAEVVGRLRALGMTVELLTGDHAAAASHVAARLGLDAVVAGARPDDKLARVRALQAEGRRVLMIGDGVNDAPALAAADVGMAAPGGVDLAAASAAWTLLRADLHLAADAVVLSRAAVRVVRQNLTFAFLYNLLALPVAAGVLVPFGGPGLTPTLASALMACSSLSVLLSSLRLRRLPLDRSSTR